MKETKLITCKEKIINKNNKIFPILEKKDMAKWLCFYDEKNYHKADNFYRTLNKASKAYGLKIAEPKWVEMSSDCSEKGWIENIEYYLSENNERYSFVMFLLEKNKNLYEKLIQHSLYKLGYVSQVVNIKKTEYRNSLSICSKILLQLNSKLGGISYKIDFYDNKIYQNLMIVGVSSSHITNKRTGIGMVATINDSFTNFFNKEDIINEENKKQISFNIKSFLEKAFEIYRQENKLFPKNLIIYRQGVSLEQKYYLRNEIKQINNLCEYKNISFYYILVNKKLKYKFFEKGKNEFCNPSPNLLVLDGITNKNFFEFYIQPQEVTEGSAIPTCYHVAYGNLNYLELIPKLTFDLCSLHFNWNGKIRVPHVISAAKKLSRIAAKYMPENINSYFRLGKEYL